MPGAADLQARYDAAVVATRKAFDAYREAKTERILIGKGKRHGDLSLAWVKSDAARMAYEAAEATENDLSYELDDA